MQSLLGLPDADRVFRLHDETAHALPPFMSCIETEQPGLGWRHRRSRRRSIPGEVSCRACTFFVACRRQYPRRDQKTKRPDDQARNKRGLKESFQSRISDPTIARPGSCQLTMNRPPWTDLAYHGCMLYLDWTGSSRKFAVHIKGNMCNLNSKTHSVPQSGRCHTPKSPPAKPR